MGRLLSLLLLSSFYFSGCGPSQTARQSEKDQLNRHLKQSLGEMANIEGKWQGTLTPIGRNISNEEMSAYLQAINLKPDATNMQPGPIQIVRNFNAKPPVTPRPPAPPAPPAPRPPNVNLQVLVASVLSTDITRNEVTEVPTLMGVWRAPGSEDAQIVFTTGLYNPATGHIQLNSAVIPLPTSSVVAPTILQLQLDGPDHLVGRLIAPQLIGDVDFRRVQ